MMKIVLTTPELKISPVPISFIPFNNEKQKCNDCGDKYSVTLLYEQKYCKNCLLSYVKNLTDNDTTDMYLDVYINTNNSNTQCIEHETTRNMDFSTRNIQEWCKCCSEILYFQNYYQNSSEFKFRPDCYQISSWWMESTLTKKPIPILYLPWWDASNKSRICNHNLKFISDCQKWCSDCFIIYAGCRYCLTTNIIFGITDQSQCKKCKRILMINIDIGNITSGDCNIDEFLTSTRTNLDSHHQIAEYMNNIDKNSDPLNVYDFIESKLKNIGSKRIMRWIPYSQITFLETIAQGGFGTVYKAIWSNKTPVAVKRFSDGEYFLNELKSLHKCYDMVFIIKYYGITKNPETKEYMLVMEYADGGDLHNYLKNNFTNIGWYKKLAILCQISDGLKTIHNENFIHRDFHSGNILSLKKDHNKWVIGDLGLSQPTNSSNNEIYGVIPYIAPEILKVALDDTDNGARFSKESDIYSMGMIMWELTTGHKPFDNVDHDHILIYNIIIHGKRPEITNDTPECFAELMKKCWDADPSKRPSIIAIKETLDDWYKSGAKILFKAEKKRKKSTKSKGPCPESHPGAVYTSRPLNPLISQSSFINSSSTIYIPWGNRGYISNELDFDIDTNTQRLPATNINSTTQNFLNTQQQNAIFTSRQSNPLISSLNTSKRRRIQDNE